MITEKKARIIAGLTILLLFPKTSQSQINAYRIYGFAEFKYNPYTLYENDIDAAWYNFSDGYAYTKNFGLNFLTVIQNNGFGIGFSLNHDFIDLRRVSLYYHSVQFKNFKISGIYERTLSRFFSISLFPEYCHFNYEFFNKGASGRYLNEDLNTGALSLSMRFNTSFTIFNITRLGIHIGIQSPYIFLNPGEIKSSANAIGYMIGLNYGIDLKQKSK